MIRQSAPSGAAITVSTIADKIDGLRAAMTDELFKQDLKEIASDFAPVDRDGWDA